MAEPEGSSGAGSRSTRHPHSTGHDANREFAFVDVPRLELDQLLGQLVERAQEVMASQGRLRGLLRAHQAVGSDLDLPVVLRRIVEAARELVGANYAALGVIGSDGHLIEFIHSGMPDSDAAVIGHLPQGKGLLGALIDIPEPIRLSRIADDDRSSGFPPGHPPMDSFLGVPIRIRDEVYGNLYLAESTRGEFTAEDQELTLTLAASAAVAIANARLYDIARDRGRWLRAAATVTNSLLFPPVPTAADDPALERPPQDPWTLIASLCRSTANADLASIWLLTEDDDRLRAAVRVGADDLPDLNVSADTPLFRDVLLNGTPSLLTSLEESGSGVSATGFDVGPLMILPLAGINARRGVVTVVRRRGRPVFTTEDLDMAAGFTNQAAVALELADARAEQQRVALLDERDRIAADLHDHIIQQLFATGLSLHSAAAGMPPGRSTQRVLDAVRDLDGVIGQIRTTIFALNQAGVDGPAGLRARMLDLVTELTAVLGFEPVLRFAGPIETVTDPDLAPDLLAVAREALTNVARHAHATTAEVELTAAGGELVLRVCDDGVGISADGRRSGLHNMRRRAEQRGGRFTLEQRVPRGTAVTWIIPPR
ncbi:GAF domain-containing sensor histidine kinase [Pseudonocardia dioxanivorans]|uniref:GAF domain-containing sensor histidine kinase n=1 Tax=Pseudonocardia dioxanivorans TaxID=240495 RepID=UPI00104339E6|nr:GAF domain-containing sensor histidine kinase [Pseudonocardia dioxanivorans]